MAKARRVTKERLGVSQKVMADGDGLRSLQVRIPGHQPPGVGGGLLAKDLDQIGQTRCRVGGHVPAEQAQIQSDLVIARPPRVQRGAGRRDLGQTPLDGRVDVFIRWSELESATVQLTPDAAQAALDRCQL